MPLHSSDLPANVPEPNRSTGQPEKCGLPLFKVVLLPDGNHDMMYMVRTIMELVRFCRAEATHKMWETRHFGRSSLLVTYKERAELYAEQFSERGLGVTLEKA